MLVDRLGSFRTPPRGSVKSQKYGLMPFFKFFALQMSPQSDLCTNIHISHVRTSTLYLPRTKRNDRTADGTAISKYIGRDSQQ